MSRRTLKAGVDTVSGFGLKAFSEDDIETLHFATLEVLRDVGVKVVSEEALEILSGGGAKVERYDGYGIVRFPHYLVEDCIRWAPHSIMFHGRRPEDDYAAESKRVGFSTFGECVQLIDPETKQIRSTTKQDLADATRVCDSLDEIVIVERMMGSLDMEAATQPLHNYEAMVSNTSKHCILGFGSAANARRIIEMATVCAGGERQFNRRPIVSAFVCPTSPLVLGQSLCDVVIECARSGLGIAVIPMALSGATATATISGTLVIHNAEVLSTLVLAQLTSKGINLTYSSCSTIMDLKTAVPAVGAPEYGIFSAGLTKLAQHYKLTSWVGGGHSDSKLPDAQAAYEAGLTALTSALAGANIIYGAGSLESGMTFDYAKLVMDTEQIRRIQKIIEGIEVTDDNIALDVIKEIGPGGEFMTHGHTFTHMDRMSRTYLFDRRKREIWLRKTGGRDLTTRAYEEAARILDTHTPLPLPAGAAEAMREIIEEYEAELAL